MRGRALLTGTERARGLAGVSSLSSLARAYHNTKKERKAFNSLSTLSLQEGRKKRDRARERERERHGGELRRKIHTNFSSDGLHWLGGLEGKPLSCSSFQVSLSVSPETKKCKKKERKTAASILFSVGKQQQWLSYSSSWFKLRSLSLSLVSFTLTTEAGSPRSDRNGCGGGGRGCRRFQRR